ncbi:MAG: pyridoxal-phosphate dependent enzyme [Thermoanaerobaculia bacterium]|nr:pyridoxal-phosphate dependent enzyme [Thermoanaerobaculia bacterium]
MNAIRTQGDPILQQPCEPVSAQDVDLAAEAEACHEALALFRAEHGFGRAIAAPQLGFAKRFVCLNLGATPFTVINPEITWRSEEKFEVWDDCLSLPDIVVRVERHRSISLTYVDDRGRRRTWERLPEDMSELLQHEIDHLDGILMTQRAAGSDAVRPISEHADLVGAERREHRLSLPAIARAAEAVDPVFLHSPQFESESLSAELACSLTLKVETVNPIRCFKGRGADYFVADLVQRGDERPLVCASAGNFGQAMAYACGKHGRPLTVFAATTANTLKIERMKALGAEVRLAGRDFDAAKDAAREFAQQRGALWVEDGREPAISEGAGSLAVELLARDDAFDDLLVPLGNGALLAGVGRWFRAASPATRIVGVCSTGADAMARSWREGRIVQGDSVRTIADGIGVRVPVPEALADLEGLIDDVVLVDDEAILRAMRLIFDHTGLLTEPAAAVGVAVPLTDTRFVGSRVATILTGGNMTVEETESRLFRRRIER